MKAAFAMPVILIICGEPGASSVSVTLAACIPTERGVKFNTIVQEPLAAIAVLQVGSASVNSFALAPPSTAFVRCNAAVPAFVTVTFIGVLVPCVLVPKSGLPGFTTMADVGAEFAVPWTFMRCGESGASSVSVTVAVRNPAARGVNVTEMVQTEFAARGAVHVGLVELKSLVLAPVMAILEI